MIEPTQKEHQHNLVELAEIVGKVDAQYRVTLEFTGPCASVRVWHETEKCCLLSVQGPLRAVFRALSHYRPEDDNA